MTVSDRSILLFYAVEERDKFVRNDRHLERFLRPFYDRVTGKRGLTGFDVSFRLLVAALRSRGHEVRVNDNAYARAHPAHSVGLVGTTYLLREWLLPNPALLVPSLFDHPGLARCLMDDPRFRRHIVLADWFRAMFEPVYGARSCVSWFAGIDTDAWPDTRGRTKEVDVLLYDKIRWDRHAQVPCLLNPIRAELRRRDLRVEELRYGRHDHAAYRSALERSRAMVFVCEHETQGLAYQEALASNVPVLVWDFGMWTDPLWKVFSDAPIPASSVPFFSSACGDTFRPAADFPLALDPLTAALDRYEPRAYVRENPPFERSARIYADACFGLAA